MATATRGPRIVVQSSASQLYFHFLSFNLSSPPDGGGKSRDTGRAGGKAGLTTLLMKDPPLGPNSDGFRHHTEKLKYECSLTRMKDFIFIESYTFIRIFPVSGSWTYFYGAPIQPGGGGLQIIYENVRNGCNLCGNV